MKTLESLAQTTALRHLRKK